MDEARLNLSSIVEMLTDAYGRLHTARQDLERAQRDETAALNDVNQAQKALEEFMYAARAAAPFGTDWYFNGRKGEEA